MKCKSFIFSFYRGSPPPQESRKIQGAGVSKEIPTLNGIYPFKLEAHSFDQLDHRLKGFGLPDPKGQYKGDLLVHFFMEHPRKLSKNDKSRLKSWAKSWPQGEMMQEYQSYLDKRKATKK